MHCPACEVLVEKKLLEQDTVKSAEASLADGTVQISYTGRKPKLRELNKQLEEDEYRFEKENIKTFPEPPLFVFRNGTLEINHHKILRGLFILGIAVLIILGFVLVDHSGFSSLLSVNDTSTLPAFFIFGLLAGTSSCAALVGGIVLSMSKQWGRLYANEHSRAKQMQPHVLFNIGRIVSFAFLGGVLGFIGGTLQISLPLTASLTIGVSVMMLVLGLQMMGVKRFERFQAKPPKFLTHFISDEHNFKGRYMPAIMGALTFFLPCGFTITAQGLALASGSPQQGAMIMFFFSLGTLPMLIIVGVSSVKLLNNRHFSKYFLKAAGVLVLFFALYNINSQLVVLNLPNVNDLYETDVSAANTNLPPIVNGKQVIEMDAYARTYTPNTFKVQAGIPVLWKIHDKGTSGCTNAVISQSLFEGEIRLTPGETSTRTFTPTKPGKYRFSCWMGMVTGTIEVVDASGKSGSVVGAGEFAEGAGCGDVR